MPVYCPQCGAESPDSRGACSNCQTLLLGADVDVITGRRCDECGRQVLVNAKHCHCCGAELPARTQQLSTETPAGRQRTLVGAAAAVIALVAALLLAGIPLTRHRSAMSVSDDWKLASLAVDAKKATESCALHLHEDGHFELMREGAHPDRWRGAWQMHGPLLRFVPDESTDAKDAPDWIGALLSGEDVHWRLMPGGAQMSLRYVPASTGGRPAVNSLWRRRDAGADR